MSTTIYFPESGAVTTFEEGETLLDAIRRAEIPIEAICAGRGTCGKCRVRVNGKEGLACQTPAADGMRVEVLSDAEGQVILTDSGAGGRAQDNSRIGGRVQDNSRIGGRAQDNSRIGRQAQDNGRIGRQAQDKSGSGPDDKVAIAIDVGTTTIVVKAIGTVSGEDLSVRAFTNPQRVYGADVLSRINESMDDASLLSGIVREALDAAIRDIVENDIPASPEKIVIAGNTTMMYLLLGLRARSLGLAPFEPEYRLMPIYPYQEVFGTDALSCPVHMYPYISAFIGGDIVSGLVNIGRHLEGNRNTNAPSFILVDMGTNGEIAFRCGDRLLATSTAAGPALEGGNITCGMSGLPGAIYEAKYEGDGKFSYKTIADKPAQGICGSGVISLMGALLDAGLVSPTGAFTEEAGRIAQNKEGGAAYKELVIAGAGGNDGALNGGKPIVFTQKDVREFQLAKGAIRAGIDILIEEMGEAPKTLYLAGGFGQNIDLKSAFRVGLIPGKLEGKVRFVGNTSLGGCVDACACERIETCAAGQVDECDGERLGADTGECVGTDVCAGKPAEERLVKDDNMHADEGANMSAGTETAPDSWLDVNVAPLLAMTEEINLGSHKKFNNKFMETMMFDWELSTTKEVD